MSDMRLLQGRIVQKFGTQGKFAIALGNTEQTVAAKLNGRSRFSRDDIIKWCKMLDIESDDIGEYFFGNELSKS